MAISKSAKRWIIILSAPFVLLLIALIGLKLYFTNERLKELLIPRIEEASRRNVRIHEISLSLFPFAVEIDSLVITNPAGAKFTREEFLTLDRLTLRMKLFELLSGRAEITDVTLRHPVLYLEKSSSGAKNYSSTPSRDKEPPPGESAATGAGALLLSHCEIFDGEIHYADRKYDGRMIIAGWYQTLRAEIAEGEGVLRAEGSSSIRDFSYGNLTSWYIAGAPLDGEVKISYDLGTDILSFDQCTASLKDLKFSMKGTIAKLKEDTMIFDLSVTSPGASMEQLLSLIPPEMLKKTAGLESSGEVKFTMNIKGPFSDAMNPGASGSFTIENGTVKYASLPKSIMDIDLRGAFDRPSARIGATGIGTFEIEKFSARFGSDKLEGAVAISNFSDPRLVASFNGTLNLGDVKSYYPLEQGTDLSGTSTISVKLEGKATTPQSIRATGSAGFQDVSIATAGTATPLRHLNGTISFNNQVVESKSLAMTIGPSDLTMGFTLKNYLGLVMPEAAGTSGKPHASVTLASRQLRTADLTGEAPAPPDHQQAGAAAPKKQQSMIPPVDVDANVSIDKLVTEKFTFTNVRGSLSISEGIINLKNLNLNAFQGSIQTKGTLDLRDEKKRPFDLEMNISGVQSNDLLSHFTSFGQYLFGKFSTTTRLKGDLNDTLGVNPATLLGGGDVRVAEGKLAGLPLTSKLADVTGLTDLREVNFATWTNAFAIEGGRVQVRDLKINAGATDFAVQGSQGLDGSLDYSLNVKLPSSVSDRIQLGGVAGELLEFFKEKDGRYNLTFGVGGTSTAPTLRLDTRAQEEAAKRKLENELKRKAEEGLLKLFKKP